jgi:hypothetical protein
MFRYFTDGILKRGVFNKKEITQIAHNCSEDKNLVPNGTEANVLEEVLKE